MGYFRDTQHNRLAGVDFGMPKTSEACIVLQIHLLLSTRLPCHICFILSSATAQ